MKKNIYFFLLFFLFKQANLFAQDTLSPMVKKKVFLELGISANSYKGSLTANYGNYTSSSFHCGIKFNKKTRMNGKFNLSIGSISSQNTSNLNFVDAKGNVFYPISYFKTSITNLSYELNLVLLKKKKIAANVFGGIGVSKFNVKDFDGNDLANNLSSRAKGEDFNSISFFFPLGLNAEYIWKENFRSGFSVNVMNPLTDFFDNTSQYSPYKTVKDNVLMLKFYVSAPLAFK